MEGQDVWTTIESDPGVFTELIELMGVQSVQVDEIFEIEAAALQQYDPVYGIIFLFKYKGDEVKGGGTVVEPPPGLFFAKQTIPNACATQAILSILLNEENINIGSELQALKSFAECFPPDVKGLSIGNSEAIRSAHNSFARADPLVPEEKAAPSSEDAYHFISYIHFAGAIYELDGLQAGPIKHVECQQQEWLKEVVPIITGRMEAYAQNEISFNCLVVTGSRIDSINNQILELQQKKNSQMETDQNDQIQTLDIQIQSLERQLVLEKDKKLQQRIENQRRRHNFVPLIFNLLRLLAEKDQLMPLVEAAKKNKKQAA